MSNKSKSRLILCFHEQDLINHRIKQGKTFGRGLLLVTDRY
jgi:hypothetical protein